MTEMFLDCESLKSVDMSAFDTSRVISMSLMFGGCRSLESLDLSGFDISSLDNGGGGIVYGCSSLKKILPPPGWPSLAENVHNSSEKEGQAKEKKERQERNRKREL